MDKEIFHCLYQAKNVPDALDMYCGPLLRAANPLIRLKAKKLLNYWSLLTDEAFFNRRIQKVFYTLYQEIDKNFPDMTYELSGRIKGLFSSLNKMDEIEDATMAKIEDEFIKSKVASNPEADNMEKEIIEALASEDHNEVKAQFAEFFLKYDFSENPFDRIRDFFAFRIVIEDEGNGDMIEELYQVTNLMITFFNSSTFEVVPSHQLLQTGIVVKSDIIHIPKKSGLDKRYSNLVKDYVMCPKKDGYQSIHFVVFDPYTERHFEVQVRTRSMDMISLTLANHETYKERRYGKHRKEITENIDFSRIKIKGFRYFEYEDPKTNEKKYLISDKAGITEAIPIKLEFEHFLTF